jgi:phosphohistidine phosphatase
VNLYIVRHAWALEADAAAFPDDAQRPLSRKGRRRFERLAERLAERGVAPAVVAASPLVRAQQTAEILVRAIRPRPRLETLEALAPGSNLAQLLSWLRDQGEDAAWVGHAPDVATLCGALIGAPPEGLRFPKGAIAALRFGSEIEPGHAVLRWLATARLLGV